MVPEQGRCWNLQTGCRSHPGFFFNWFNLLSPDYSAVGPDALSVIWAVIDAALPLLLGAQGVTLLRSGK